MSLNKYFHSASHRILLKMNLFVNPHQIPQDKVL